MNKLEKLMSQLTTLSPEEQEKVAEVVSAFVQKNDDFYELTPAELAELDLRLSAASKEPTYTIEEVFHGLK